MLELLKYEHGIDGLGIPQSSISTRPLATPMNTSAGDELHRVARSVRPSLERMQAVLEAFGRQFALQANQIVWQASQPEKASRQLVRKRDWVHDFMPLRIQ